MTLIVEEFPRLVAAGFSVYSLLLVIFRWQATRVLTVERRFLLAFFVLEASNTVVGALVKALADRPIDVSSWGSALTQAFLAAYLFYSIPAEYRRFHYRFTRRRS